MYYFLLNTVLYYHKEKIDCFANARNDICGCYKSRLPCFACNNTVRCRHCEEAVRPTRQFLFSLIPTTTRDCFASARNDVGGGSNTRLSCHCEEVARPTRQSLFSLFPTTTRDCFAPPAMTSSKVFTLDYIHNKQQRSKYNNYLNFSPRI